MTYLSILVVSRTHENVSRLLNVLESSRISCDFEVICSWNGSDGESSLIVIPSGMDFRVFIQRPYNFAKNNNQLAGQARGSYILFLNDDVVPEKNCINNALSAINDPAIGMVGINLRYGDDRLQHAGVFFREDGTPFHRLKHQVKWNDPSVGLDMFVPAITGAFILMRRDEFLQLKFDETFRVCGEDIALCLSYREMFPREILYVANATAIHQENMTRKKFGETKTPKEDMDQILRYSRKVAGDRPLVQVRRPKVRIVTEKPGWIMYRKGEEIAKYMGSVKINEDMPDAEIHYYINYGYFNQRPLRGLAVANFTHYDPNHLADKFLTVAKEVDHCVAVSEATANILADLGIPRSKISVIVVGADRRFRPKLTLGVVGRIYPGSRKGEDIISELCADSELMERINIVAAGEGWGVPVWGAMDIADFYRAIDYLLVPSRLEGGPIPFMEALACGTMAVAPEIGVVPEFPHVSYPVGDVPALKKILLTLAGEHQRQRSFIADSMKGLDWEGWAMRHDRLFRRLLWERGMSDKGFSLSSAL